MKKEICLVLFLVLISAAVQAREPYTPQELETRLSNLIDLSIQEDLGALDDLNPEEDPGVLDELYDEPATRAALEVEKEKVMTSYNEYYAYYRQGDVVQMEASLVRVAYQLDAFETHLNAKLNVSGLLAALSRSFADSRQDIIASGAVVSTEPTPALLDVDPVEGASLIQGTYRQGQESPLPPVPPISQNIGLIFLVAALAALIFIALYIVRSRRKGSLEYLKIE